MYLFSYLFISVGSELVTVCFIVLFGGFVGLNILVDKGKVEFAGMDQVVFFPPTMKSTNNVFIRDCCHQLTEYE